MTDQVSMHHTLAREWLWARIIVLGGFAIAILVAVYFAFGWRLFTHVVTPEEAARARGHAVVQAELQICTIALDAAKGFGIIPPYGRLPNANLRKTDVQGRYVCIAATSVTKYLLAADLLCREFRDPRCVSLYSITQDDGTVLYQRHS